MNKFKFLSLSLMALLMACFTACNNNAAVDYSEYIVGTWTAHLTNYAEALVGRSMEHYGALSISRTAHLKRGGRNCVRLRKIALVP